MTQQSHTPVCYRRLHIISLEEMSLISAGILPKDDQMIQATRKMIFFGAAVYLCVIISIVLLYGHDVFLGSFVSSRLHRV